MKHTTAYQYTWNESRVHVTIGRDCEEEHCDPFPHLTTPYPSPLKGKGGVARYPLGTTVTFPISAININIRIYLTEISLTCLLFTASWVPSVLLWQIIKVVYTVICIEINCTCSWLKLPHIQNICNKCEGFYTNKKKNHRSRNSYWV